MRRSSRRRCGGTTASATVSVANLQNKVGGAIALDAAGYYQEPGMAAIGLKGGTASSTAIKNSGPYPPKINAATTYTVHWRITNYATDAQNVTVSATLQSGAMCTGETKLSIPSSTLTCDPATGQVTWQIPFIPATTGVVNAPAKRCFR